MSGRIAAGALVVSAAFYVLCARALPFYNKSEPREALVARAIVDGASVWLPLREGRDVPSKPPLFHWLAAAALRLGLRPEELAVRLPSCLASAMTLALTAAVAARWYGGGAGVLAAAILGSSLEWLHASIQARVDMTLALFVVAAALAFHAGQRSRGDGGPDARARTSPPAGARALHKACAPAGQEARTHRWLNVRTHRWLRAHTHQRLNARTRPWLIRAGCLLGAAAVLTKGPVGIVLPLLVALAGAAATGGLRRARPLADPVGAALAGALVLGWYLLAWMEGGRDFLERQILHENVRRFLGGGDARAAHAEPFYYYGRAILGGFLPWTTLLPLAAIRAWRCRAPQDRFLAAWIVAVLAFFSVAAGKRSAYLLPLFPPLAMLTGRALADAFASPPGRPRRWTAWGLAGIVALAALGSAAGWAEQAGRWIAPYLHARDLANARTVTAFLVERRWAAAATLAATAAALAVCAGGGTRGSAATIVGLCLVALAWAGGLTAFGTYPIARTLTLHPFAEQVRTILQDGDVLWMRGWVDYGFRYYVRHPLRPWSQRRESTGGREFVVGEVPEDDAAYRRRGLAVRITDLRAAPPIRHDLAEVRRPGPPSGTGRGA